MSGAGTGGTIAGVSCYLKLQRPRVAIFLIDPPGSSLYNKVGSRCAVRGPQLCSSLCSSSNRNFAGKCVSQRLDLLYVWVWGFS